MHLLLKGTKLLYHITVSFNGNMPLDTDAQSYACRSVFSCSTSMACILFPLCSVGRWSVDGLLALEAQFTVQRFADRFSTKWSKPYNEVMVWLQTRLSFAIL